MDAFKLGLVVFLVLAVTFVVVTFLRGVWTTGLPVRRSSSHFGQLTGATPPPDGFGETDGGATDRPPG